MSTLEPIVPNRSLTLYSPLEGKNEQLVRTGTLGSILHSILHCCDQGYVRKNNEEREEHAQNLLKEMIDEELWSQTEGSVKEIEKTVQQILSDFYEAIEEDGQTDNKYVLKVLKKTKAMDRLAVYTLITELIPLEEMSRVDTALHYLDSTEEMQELSIKKASGLRSIVSELLNTVKNVATKLAYKKYKENIDPNNPKNISIFCDHFDRDIYVIDPKDRMPFHWKGTGERKAIILIAMKDHYEPVGRLLLKKRIQREYNAGDDLIKKIRIFLEKPDKVKSKYPELIPYLKTVEQNDSDSE